MCRAVELLVIMLCLCGVKGRGVEGQDPEERGKEKSGNSHVFVCCLLCDFSCVDCVSSSRSYVNLRVGRLLFDLKL